MVRHIVMWCINKEITGEACTQAKLRIKNSLEALKDIVPGTISVKVEIDALNSSNRDIALISEFESKEALKGYQVHPGHVEAGAYIKTVTCERACFDYEF